MPAPTTARICTLLALLTTATLAPAAVPPELQPAAPANGLRGASGDPGFANPAFGPVESCARLRRQLIVLNPRLVQGEPLHMRVFLTREDDEPEAPELLIQTSFATDIHVQVKPPKGSVYRFEGLRTGSTVPTAAVDFEGIRNYHFDLRLATDRDSLTGAAFDMPGNYQIGVQLTCRDRGTRPTPQPAGIFDIVVEEATGDDRVALDLLDGDHEIFNGIQMLRSRLGSIDILTPAQLAKLQTLVERAPKARLRPYAMIVLANALADELQWPEAIVAFRRIHREYPGHPAGDLAHFDEMRMLQLSSAKSSQLWEHFVGAWQDPYLTQSIQPGSPNWEAFVAPFLPEPPATQWMLWAQPGGPDPEFEVEGENQGRVNVTFSPEYFTNPVGEFQ